MKKVKQLLFKYRHSFRITIFFHSLEDIIHLILLKNFFRSSFLLILKFQSIYGFLVGVGAFWAQ